MSRVRAVCAGSHAVSHEFHWQLRPVNPGGVMEFLRKPGKKGLELSLSLPMDKIMESSSPWWRLLCLGRTCACRFIYALVTLIGAASDVLHTHSYPFLLFIPVELISIDL